MFFNLEKRLSDLRKLAALTKFMQEPGKLESVFAVADTLKGGELGQAMARHLLANPQVAEMARNRWTPQPLDLAALQALPTESLGYCFFQHLHQAGIRPEDLRPDMIVQNDTDWLMRRFRQTHDIVHVLTGFGIDGPGELGVQAFNLAQNYSPLGLLLIFAGLLSAMKEQEPIEDILKAIARGITLGLNAQLLLAHRFEEHWEKPLAQWRQELNLDTSLS